MENNKNRDLAISATSKIYEKVNRSLSERDSDKRWFWELLQNAKDTVVYKNGIDIPFNIPDRKVSVKLVLSTNPDSGPFIRFEHNGNPFLYSNHIYKYDDPKCLLLADSGKIEEDEELREDITGQFGTGFLSTHILSLRILVEGLFFDKNQQMSNFSFILNRRFENKLQLASNVEESLDQYDANFKSSNEMAEFSTKFTYFLKDHKEGEDEGLKVALEGFNGINYFIPFVLAFSKEIKSLEVIKSIDGHSTIQFLRESDLVKTEKGAINIDIIQKDSNVTLEKKIQIIMYSDLVNHIDIALQIEETEGGFRIIPPKSELPVLFCVFPFIGSHKWRFPAMLNCSRFYPRTERDGILLLTNKDNGNQSRIEQAADLYKKLVEFCVEKEYEELYWLASIQDQQFPEWVTEDWNRLVNDGIRTFISSQKLVKNTDDQFISINQSLFPMTMKKDDFNSFWDICYEIEGTIMPCKKDAEVWAEILDVGFQPWKEHIYDLNTLLSKIQSSISLTELAKDKFNGDIRSAISWLNKVIDYTLLQSNGKNLLNDFKIIPSQSADGPFDFLEELRYDVNVPEELKDVLDLFDKDIREKLIHIEIDRFIDHSPLSVEDVSEIVNKHISDIKRIDNENFLKGMYLLCSSFTTTQSEKRNLIYSFAKDLFPLAIVEKRFLPTTSDFIWSSTNKWIVKRIVAEVHKKDTITNLSSDLLHSAESETILWLNTLVNFLNVEDYKDHLENFRIIPNQYNDLCVIKFLYDDNDVIPNALKEILYDLSDEKEDLKAILLKDGIEIKLDRPKTIRNITERIDDLIKENRDNLGNPSIRNAMLSLVKWTSDNNNRYPIEDLFKWFSLNKANLVLNTLDSGNDRDNIFEIIQSGKSLNALAIIARSGADLTIVSEIAALNDSMDLKSALSILSNYPDITAERLEGLLLLEELSKGWNPELVYTPSEDQIRVNFETGWKGEAFVYKELLKKFEVEWPNKSIESSGNVIIDFEGESHFIDDKMQKYDLVINDSSGNKSFIQVKTTTTDIAQADVIALPISTREWKFVHETNDQESYYLARVFNIDESPELYFMKLEDLKAF